MEKNGLVMTRRMFLKASGLAGILAAVGGLLAESGCSTGAGAGSGTAAAAGEHYTFTVVSGAVITASDAATGKFKYKRHCDTCGWQEFFSRSVNGESVNDAFTCPRCTSHQVVSIVVEKVSGAS